MAENMLRSATEQHRLEQAAAEGWLRLPLRSDGLGEVTRPTPTRRVLESLDDDRGS